MSALSQRLVLRARPRRHFVLPAPGPITTTTTITPGPAAAQALAHAQAQALARQRQLFSSTAVSSAATDATEGPPPIPPIFDPKYARYKARKVWPPDFARLSPQEQLRFEKRFKRRMAIRAERPRWTKFIKLTQLFTVTFVAIYCVLFHEWKDGPQPFQGIRDWFWGTLAALRGGQRAAIRPAGTKDGVSAEAAASQAATKQ